VKTRKALLGHWKAYQCGQSACEMLTAAVPPTVLLSAHPQHQPPTAFPLLDAAGGKIRTNEHTNQPTNQ